MREGFTCPLDLTHRVSFGLKQSFQIDKQRFIGLLERVSSSSFLSYSLTFFIDVSCFYFPYPLSDRIWADFRLSGDGCQIPTLLGLHRQILPPLPTSSAMRFLQKGIRSR